MINIIFTLIYFFSFNFADANVYCILLIIHCCLCILQHLREKKNITPIFVFYFGVIITTIADFVLIGKIETQGNKFSKYIVPRYINDALQLWTISCSFIIIGYQFFIDKTLPSIALEVNNKKFYKYLFYFLVTTNLLALFGYGVALRGNQLGKIFGLVNSIGILFFARVWAKEDNSTYRLYALSLFVIETYVALVSSYLRFELILPTFYLFAGYFIGKGNVRYMFSYRIIPFVAIILVYSSVFSTLQSNRSNFISVFNEDSPAPDKSNENSGALLDRSANVAQLTNIVNLVQRNGFYDGKASAPLLAALIPRALWPDKPLIQLGTWFALEIGMAYQTEGGRANNSINMTIPGELYLDFGWIGLIIGSLGMGALMAALWNSTKFYISEYNLTGTLFGGYLFIMSISGFGGDLQIVITFLSTYLSFFIIKRIVASQFKL